MSSQTKINQILTNLNIEFYDASRQFLKLPVSSQAWQIVTDEQQKKFEAVVLLFTSKIIPLCTKYHQKHTVKGEFIADVLEDYYYDLVQRPLDGLDDELENYVNSSKTFEKMSLSETRQAFNNLIQNLYERCQHPKKLVKTLKLAYHDHEDQIRNVTKTNDQNEPDLAAITDISANYRDLLYKEWHYKVRPLRLLIFPTSNKEAGTIMFRRPN